MQRSCDIVGTMRGRRIACRTGLIIAALAGGITILTGCGSRSSVDPALPVLNQVAGEQLGRMIAGDVPDGGDLVLVHNRANNQKAVEAWIAGLELGTGSAFNVVEMDAAQFRSQNQIGVEGFPALAGAMTQHAGAAAIVTTLSIGDYERPKFPATHPPVYALDWNDLATGAFLFRGDKLKGGVFLNPAYDPMVPLDAKEDPQALFDREYVLVNAENLRASLALYRRQ